MDAGITISSTSQPALVRRLHRKRNRRTNPSLSLGPRVAGDEYVTLHPWIGRTRYAE